MANRVEINQELLEQINGGAIGFDPEGNDMFTMRCEFSGNVYPHVSLSDLMRIAQFAAAIPNTAEGEQQIINWAHDQGII